MSIQSYSLMIHGGAGSVADKKPELAKIRAVTATGESMLKRGASALDVVEHCVMLLENDTSFNAGRGSVLNHDGNVELDASIMDGLNMRAGAVAGITRVKNPVHLARTILEQSDYVFLIGPGAEEFADAHNVERADASYFETPHRTAQLREAIAQDRTMLDHTPPTGHPDIGKKYGTVGAVARDHNGNLAAATSTGGVVNKRYGRVGDTPVIGAGVFAENGIGAISCTGYGEQFLRTVMAKHIADIMRFQQVDAQVAAERGIAYLVEKAKGLGGVIVIDSNGVCGKAFSTLGMITGSVTQGQPIIAMLD